MVLSFVSEVIFSVSISRLTANSSLSVPQGKLSRQYQLINTPLLYLFNLLFLKINQLF